MLLPTLFALGALAHRTWTPEHLDAFLKETLTEPSADASPVEQFRSVASDVAEALDWSSDYHADDKPDYEFFQFLPTLVGKAIPGGAKISGEGRCLKSMEVSSVVSGDSIEVTINASGRKSFACSEFLFFATTNTFALKEVWFLLGSGKTSVTLSLADATDAEKDDAMLRGVRVFRFSYDLPQLVKSVGKTAALLAGFAIAKVPMFLQDMNDKFLKDYAGIDLEPRPFDNMTLPASEIHSGDFLGIVRMDGIDPILAWAQGAQTGHTTIAVWDDDQLYIYESTTKDAYWPTNGIQRTKYEDWIPLARKAGHNTVLLPLSDEARTHFNATAANAWFKTVEGRDYGFPNLLLGWIDTTKDNYPCTPPNFQNGGQCLEWDLVEVIFPLLERNKVTHGADILFSQALNHRVGTSGKTLAEVFQAYGKADLSALPTIPEQDSWKYNQTLNAGGSAMGPSMVCDVFVCRMYKEGGLFKGMFNLEDDEFNCGEFMNNDLYGLTKMYNAKPKRPQACTDADPKNDLCQLTGKWELNLKLNTWTAHEHMFEKCPTEAPKYARPADC